MAGFGMALAGGLAGLGDSLVSKAKAEREERLAAIKRQWDQQDATLAHERALSRMETQNQYGIDAENRGYARADAEAAKLGQFYKSAFDPARMDQSALEAMAVLEQQYDVPFKVTSVYRDPDTNDAVGGAKGSQHLGGKAFDVDVSHMSIEERQQFIRDARASGFTGIGVYNNSIHIDTGGDRAWGPDYHRGTLPKWAQEAVSAPVGALAQDFDWAAFTKAPASVQDDILTAIGAAPSKKKATISNYEWIDNGKGTETKYAYVDGQQVPVTDLKGNPVTRKADKDWEELSTGDWNNIEQALEGEFGEAADPNLVAAFAGEVETLMNERDLSFAKAMDEAFKTAEREKVVTKEGGFLGIGGTEVTRDGNYTGGFRRVTDATDGETPPADAAPSVGAPPRGLDPAGQASAPASPAQPTATGDPAVPKFNSAQEVRDAYRSGKIKEGDIYINPKGQKVRLRVKEPS